MELGKRYFPRCSEVLDDILDSDDLAQLAFGEEDTPENRVQKRQRYMEIRETFNKALHEDEFRNSSLTAASSFTSKSNAGKRSKGKLSHRRR